MKKTPFFFCMLLLIGFSALYASDDEAGYLKARENMVRLQIEARGISDAKVLKAMREVPRHLFVPAQLRGRAYSDSPLPIGGGQTISQPYIVALMTESLGLKGDERVLEIGTGSGYQAAVLARIVKAVYSIEIRKDLYENASQTLESLNFTDIQTRHEDGYFGWKEAAPFDAIMITAAVDHIPPPLLGQLKENGKLILPLGNPFSYQNLALVIRKGEDYSIRQITGVLFVPMTGHASDPDAGRHR